MEEKQENYDKIYKQDPFNIENQQKLEGALFKQLNLQQTPQENLSQALYRQWKTLQYNHKNLEQTFTIIREQAPAYLYEISHRMFENLEPQEKELFHQNIQKITDIPLKKALIESHPDCAIAYINYRPNYFIALPKNLQKECMNVMLHTGKISETHTLIQIYERSIPENLIPDKEKILLLFSDTDAFYHLMQQEEHHSKKPYCQFYSNFYQKIAHDTRPTLIDIQAFKSKQAALEHIENYLKTNSDTGKKIFFEKIYQDLMDTKNNLTITFLQKHIQDIHIKTLFSNKGGWGSYANSRAAQLLHKLFLGALGCSEQAFSLNHMILYLKNPTQTPIPLHQEEGPEDLASSIQKIIKNPELAQSSDHYQVIEEKLQYFRSYTHIIQQYVDVQQKKREAIYQQYILERALQEANQDNNPVFCTTGHVLVELEINEKDILTIFQKMKFQYDENKPLHPQLERISGGTCTSHIMCRIDIAGHKTLKEKFYAAANKTEQKTILDVFFESKERGSVIDLTEEMWMHTALCLRSMEKTIKEQHDTYTPYNIHQKKAIMEKIHKHTMETFLLCLEKSYHTKTQKINFSTLNQSLDKARKVLSQTSRTILIEDMQTILERKKVSESFIHTILPKMKNGLFSDTTATGCDYLRTDDDNATSVRISGTEHTAHHKTMGKDKQALRCILRNHYNSETHQISPYLQTTQEARVPSIAVIFDKDQKRASIVQDVAHKINYSNTLLRKHHPSCTEPFIYNLLTSLPYMAIEKTVEKKNQQLKSATYIIEGVHYFNREQYKKNKTNQYCLLQNIPVNQHGRSLNDDDPIIQEIALMTDMALCATLAYHAPRYLNTLQQQYLQSVYQTVSGHYTVYLQSEAQNQFFCDTDSGKTAHMTLEKIKKECVQHTFPGKESNIDTLATQVLFKIFTQNAHKILHNGMLVQALSIFLEPLSQAGCKSANERYQAVSGRVELLKSMSGLTSDKQNTLHKTLLKAMQTYVMGETPLSTVQNALDKAYNALCLQGASVIFSEEDQGGPSKVERLESSQSMVNLNIFKNLNTNKAESPSVDRLYQTQSSQMQAHKAKLAEYFQENFPNKSLLGSQLN